MPTLLQPRTDDLARALRAKAPPREIARIVRDAEPARDPIPFKMISGPVETRATLPDGRYTGRPLIWGTHSATNTQDMHGTWWSPRALESMRAAAADGLTMWLNHDYDIPESILGSAVEAELVERDDPKAGTRHTDLDIATLVVPREVNPRALQAYEAIRNGVRLGQSVGVYILDWEWQSPDGTRLADVEDGMCGPEPYEGEEPDARLMIQDVMLVESSLVGIPSNRRGWAHEAARALRRHGVLAPVRMERLARTRAHFLGASVGEVTREMVELGHRAAGYYLASCPDPSYAALPEAERERMARFIVAAVKTGQMLPGDKLGDVTEAVIRDQSARITRMADEGCETRTPQARSTDVDPEVSATGPDAARCADCGCTCQAEAPQAGCTCECAQCRDARHADAPDAPQPAAAAPGGDPAPALAAAPTPDATLTLPGRSLEELDAALNAAGGIVDRHSVDTAPPADDADTDADAEVFAPPPQPPRAATPLAQPAQPDAALLELRAEIETARALRDDLAAQSKALRDATVHAAAVIERAAGIIEQADETGLYRPTRRAQRREVDLSPSALIQMDDDEALRAIAGRILS